MVAARDIDQGELIFSEEPLVKGPNHTITTPHCLECLKVGNQIKEYESMEKPYYHGSLLQELEEGVVCSDCGWPVCNEECAAGPNHQIECKVGVATIVDSPRRGRY